MSETEAYKDTKSEIVRDRHGDKKVLIIIMQEYVLKERISQVVKGKEKSDAARLKEMERKTGKQKSQQEHKISARNGSSNV